MALYDDPPHACTLYSVTSSRDTNGGTALTFTSAQASIPCSVNTATASEQERFAAQQIVVSHTIGILTETLTASPKRGWKAEVGSSSFHIEGISVGQSYGAVPSFTYLHCRQLFD